MSPHEMDDALTPDERALFAALPRERDPGRLLEERTVRALRDRGLVHAPGKPRRVIRFHPGWLTGAVAAGLALFLGGLATGQYMATRNVGEVVAAVQQHDQRQAAQLVQQTGSAYVQALAKLSQASNTTAGAQGQQGREVASSMLRAAADEVVRMNPNDPVATGILAAFDRAGVQQRASAKPDTAGKQSVVWF
ncbi:hypothetical protein SAMN05216486_1028 [bacterium JGI 053]|nr:hypothetical protein SAMN05216486_1028 [bacterium JGI 053]